MIISDSDSGPKTRYFISYISGTVRYPARYRTVHISGLIRNLAPVQNVIDYFVGVCALNTGGDVNAIC